MFGFFIDLAVVPVFFFTLYPGTTEPPPRRSRLHSTRSAKMCPEFRYQSLPRGDSCSRRNGLEGGPSTHEPLPRSLGR